MKGFSMKIENAPLFNRVMLASTVSLTLALSSLSIQAETPSAAVKSSIMDVKKTVVQTAKSPNTLKPIQAPSSTPVAKSTKAIQPDAGVTLSAQEKKALTSPQVNQKQAALKKETAQPSSEKQSATKPLVAPVVAPTNVTSIKTSAVKAAPAKTITTKTTSQKPEVAKQGAVKSESVQSEAIKVQSTKTQSTQAQSTVLKSTTKAGIAGAAANITPKTDSAKTTQRNATQPLSKPLNAVDIQAKSTYTETKKTEVPTKPVSTSKTKAASTPNPLPKGDTIKPGVNPKPESKPEVKTEAKKSEPAKSVSTVKPTKIPPAFVSPTAIVTEESHLPKVSDLLHQVEFDISAYPESKKLSAKLTNADEVVQILNGTKNLLVHMEAIRRGSLDLSESEKQALVQKVHARYFASENDVTKFFDNGYTQMTVLNNKSGLFFLRKANDKLANQFTSLAYALAQADADVNIERSSPANMSFRKLDVTYKMTDAVTRDAQSHQPGFWPSFTQALEKLGTIPAFTSFAHKDFSDSYVPFPNDGVLGQGGKVKIVTAESTVSDASGKPAGASCEPAISSGQDISVDLTKAFKMMPLRLGMMTPNMTSSLDKVYFFQTAQPSQYRVLAINGSRQVLADFISPQAPYIVEDLEGDGTDELVIRQYLKDKKEPVKVYRYSPVCGFQQDKTVASYFR